MIETEEAKHLFRRQETNIDTAFYDNMRGSALWAKQFVVGGVSQLRSYLQYLGFNLRVFTIVPVRILGLWDCPSG